MHSLKIVVIGDPRVGKSCIGLRYVQGTFDSQSTTTICSAFLTKIVQTSSSSVRFQIWDTAGQEQYKSLAPTYYRSAGVAIIVFSVTSEESFSSVPQWCADVREKSSEKIKIIIVGNKIDLEDQRIISSDQIEELAKNVRADEFVECSAKTGIGVDRLFQMVLKVSEDGANYMETIGETQAKTQIEPTGSCC